jgi:hypothetical protein
VKRGIALVVITCLSSAAFAAPRRAPKKGGGKTPAPAPEKAPEPVPAPAPTAPISTEPTPWAEGVPQDVQDKAGALYEEGNTLFGNQSHTAALEKYKAAIKLWDHPLIRFNLAVTEIRLERILDAADNLEASLRFGAKPFKPELYQNALDYQALIKGRVGYIEVSCDQTGAKVILDGKPFMDCPNTKKIRVLAGEHSIVAEKQSFLTFSEKFVVEGSATVTEKVKLVPLDSAITYKYPYRRWIPWTMVGLGVALGLSGTGTWFLGQNQMDQFEADFTTQCQNGCEPGLTAPEHRALAAQRDSAILKGQIGIGMMGVGGAVMLTGLVLAIMNRPTKIMPNVEVAPKTGGAVTTVGWSF